MRPEDRPDNVVQAHDCGLVVPSDDTPHCLQDGDKVLLLQGKYPMRNHYSAQFPSTFTARTVVARQITHLTLRM